MDQGLKSRIARDSAWATTSASECLLQNVNRPLDPLTFLLSHFGGCRSGYALMRTRWNRTTNRRLGGRRGLCLPGPRVQGTARRSGGHAGPDRLVRADRRPPQGDRRPELDREPGKGPLVLRGPSGPARLLRSLDRRCRRAASDHPGPRPASLPRPESKGRREVRAAGASPGGARSSCSGT